MFAAFSLIMNALWRRRCTAWMVALHLAFGFVTTQAQHERHVNDRKTTLSNYQIEYAHLLEQVAQAHHPNGPLICIKHRQKADVMRH